MSWSQPRLRSQESRVPAPPILGVLLYLWLQPLTQNDQIGIITHLGIKGRACLSQVSHAIALAQIASPGLSAIAEFLNLLLATCRQKTKHPRNVVFQTVEHRCSLTQVDCMVGLPCSSFTTVANDLAMQRHPQAWQPKHAALKYSSVQNNHLFLYLFTCA